MVDRDHRARGRPSGYKLDRLIERETEMGGQEHPRPPHLQLRGRLRALGELRKQRRQQIGPTGRATIEVGQAEQSGSLAITARNISKSFGDRTIVRDFSARIFRKDRVGLIGPNGAGKTTLLKMLIGELEPDTGSVKLGANLMPVVIDQRRTALDPDKTPWEILADRNDHVLVRGTPRHVMTYLRDYLFKDEQARQPVRTLSGGERNRLLLAKALAAPSNMLVLDEPTNDLDADTLDLPQEALAELRRHCPAGQPRPRLPRPSGDLDHCPGRRRHDDRVCRRLQRLRDPARPARDAGSGRRRAAQGKGRCASARDQGATRLQARACARRAAQEDRGIARRDGRHQRGAGRATLYSRDPKTFAARSTRLAAAQAELDTAESEWLELEMLREELGG